MKLFDIFKTNSTLKNEDLQKIKEETDFNQKEIKKSHKKFVALDKDKKGFVSTNDLASIPEVENNPLRYHIAETPDPTSFCRSFFNSGVSIARKRRP